MSSKEIQCDSIKNPSDLTIWKNHSLLKNFDNYVYNVEYEDIFNDQRNTLSHIDYCYLIRIFSWRAIVW